MTSPGPIDLLLALPFLFPGATALGSLLWAAVVLVLRGSRGRDDRQFLPMYPTLVWALYVAAAATIHGARLPGPGGAEVLVGLAVAGVCAVALSIVVVIAASPRMRWPMIALAPFHLWCGAWAYAMFACQVTDKWP